MKSSSIFLITLIVSAAIGIGGYYIGLSVLLTTILVLIAGITGIMITVKAIHKGR